MCSVIRVYTFRGGREVLRKNLTAFYPNLKYLDFNSIQTLRRSLYSLFPIIPGRVESIKYTVNLKCDFVGENEIMHGPAEYRATAELCQDGQLGRLEKAYWNRSLSINTSGSCARLYVPSIYEYITVIEAPKADVK